MLTRSKLQPIRRPTANHWTWTWTWKSQFPKRLSPQTTLTTSWMALALWCGLCKPDWRVVTWTQIWKSKTFSFQRLCRTIDTSALWGTTIKRLNFSSNSAMTQAHSTRRSSSAQGTQSQCWSHQFRSRWSKCTSWTDARTSDNTESLCSLNSMTRVDRWSCSQGTKARSCRLTALKNSRLTAMRGWLGSSSRIESMGTPSMLFIMCSSFWGT